jgi:hypothetical protein
VPRFALLLSHELCFQSVERDDASPFRLAGVDRHRGCCANLFFYGKESALGSLYGGANAVVAASMHGWRMKKISFASASAINMVHIYLGSVERFLLVALWMAVGIEWFFLPPFFMIVGLAVAQLGYLFNLTDRVKGC